MDIAKIKNSFRAVKGDMQMVFQWINYLNLTGQQTKTKLQLLEKRVSELERKRF